MTKSNSGISVTGGSVNANSIAAGKGAIAYNRAEVLGLSGELLDLLRTSALDETTKAKAIKAVEDFASEVSSGSTGGNKLMSALKNVEQLGKSGTAVLPLIDRLDPLLRRLSGLIDIGR